MEMRCTDARIEHKLSFGNWCWQSSRNDVNEWQTDTSNAFSVKSFGNHFTSVKKFGCKLIVFPLEVFDKESHAALRRGVACF